MFTLINFNQLPLAYTTLMSLIKTHQQHIQSQINQQLESDADLDTLNFKKLKQAFEQNYEIVYDNILTREQLNYCYLELGPISTKPKYVINNQFNHNLINIFFYALEQSLIKFKGFKTPSTTEIESVDDSMVHEFDHNLIKKLVEFNYKLEQSQYILSRITNKEWTIDKYQELASEFEQKHPTPKFELNPNQANPLASLFSVSSAQKQQAQACLEYLFTQIQQTQKSKDYIISRPNVTQSNLKWIIAKVLKELDFTYSNLLNSHKTESNQFFNLVFQSQKLPVDYFDHTYSPLTTEPIKLTVEQQEFLNEFIPKAHLDHNFSDRFIPKKLFFNALKINEAISKYIEAYPNFFNDLTSSQLELSIDKIAQNNSDQINDLATAHVNTNAHNNLQHKSDEDNSNVKLLINKYFTKEALNDKHLYDKLVLLREVSLLSDYNNDFIFENYNIFRTLNNLKLDHYIYNQSTIQNQQKYFNNKNFKYLEKIYVRKLLHPVLMLDISEILCLIKQCDFTVDKNIFKQLHQTRYKLSQKYYIFNLKPLDENYILSLKSISELFGFEIYYFNQIPTMHLWASSRKINRYFTLQKKLQQYTLAHNQKLDSTTTTSYNFDPAAGLGQDLVVANSSIDHIVTTLNHEVSNYYNLEAPEQALDHPTPFNQDHSNDINSSCNENELNLKEDSNLNLDSSPYTNDNLLTDIGQYQLKEVQTINRLEQNHNLETVNIFLSSYKLDQARMQFNQNQLHFDQLTQLFKQEYHNLQQSLINSQTTVSTEQQLAQVLTKLEQNPNFINTLQQIQPLPSILQQVKQSIYDYADLSTDYKFYLSPTDDSIKVIRTPNQLRELEIAYDYVLNALQQDPSLKLSDIAIITSCNIESYRQFIEQVFGQYKALSTDTTKQQTLEALTNSTDDQSKNLKDTNSDPRYLPYNIYSFSVELNLHKFLDAVFSLKADQLNLLTIEQWLSFDVINKFYGLTIKNLDFLKNILNNHNTSTAFTTESTTSNPLSAVKPSTQELVFSEQDYYNPTKDYNSWQHILLRAGLSNSFSYDNYDSIAQTQELELLKNSNNSETLAKFIVFIGDLERLSKFVNQPHANSIWLHFLLSLQHTYFTYNKDTNGQGTSAFDYINENSSYYDNIAASVLLDESNQEFKDSITNLATPNLGQLEVLENTITTDQDHSKTYLELFQKVNRLDTQDQVNNPFIKDYNHFKLLTNFLIENVNQNEISDLIVDKDVLQSHLKEISFMANKDTAKLNIQHLNFVSIYDLNSTHYRIAIVLGMSEDIYPQQQKSNELDLSQLFKQKTNVPTQYEKNINAFLNILLNTEDKILFTYNNNNSDAPANLSKPLQTLIDFLDRNCSQNNFGQETETSNQLQSSVAQTNNLFSSQNVVASNNYVFSEYNFKLDLANSLNQNFMHNLTTNSFGGQVNKTTSTNTIYQLIKPLIDHPEQHPLLSTFLSNQNISLFNEWIYQPLDPELTPTKDYESDNEDNAQKLKISNEQGVYPYYDTNIFVKYYDVIKSYFNYLEHDQNLQNEAIDHITKLNPAIEIVSQQQAYANSQGNIYPLSQKNVERFYKDPVNTYLKKLSKESEFNNSYEKEVFIGLTNSKDIKTLLRDFIKSPFNNINDLLKSRHQNGKLTPSIFYSSKQDANSIANYLNQVVSGKMTILDISDKEQEFKNEIKFPDKSCFSEQTTTLYLKVNADFILNFKRICEQIYPDCSLKDLDFTLINNLLAQDPELELNSNLSPDQNSAQVLDKHNQYYSIPMTYTIYTDPNTKVSYLYLIKHLSDIDLSGLQPRNADATIEIWDILQILACTLANHTNTVVTGKNAIFINKNTHSSQSLTLPKLLVHYVFTLKSSCSKNVEVKRTCYLYKLRQYGIEIASCMFDPEQLVTSKNTQTNYLIKEKSEKIMFSYEFHFCDLILRYLITRDCLVPVSYGNDNNLPKLIANTLQEFAQSFDKNNVTSFKSLIYKNNSIHPDCAEFTEGLKDQLKNFSKPLIPKERSKKK